MTILFWIIVFILSLGVCVKGANYFINYSERVGLKLGISPFIVGAIILGFGTSLPELATSLAAVFQSHTEIVAANVIGSNIFNILAIVGLSSLIATAGRLEVKRELIDIDLPLLALSTIILISTIIWDGIFSLFDGIISLLAFLVYFHYTLKFKSLGAEETKEIQERVQMKEIIIIILSLVAVILGAKYSIEAVAQLSRLLKIGTSFIAITAVAIGTSLPEIVVSSVAAYKGKYDISLGNIFGSNIFNSSFIMGVAGLIKPLTISFDVMTVGIPFLIIATFVYIISGISQKIHRWEGAMYLLIYILFLVRLYSLL